MCCLLISSFCGWTELYCSIHLSYFGVGWFVGWIGRCCYRADSWAARSSNLCQGFSPFLSFSGDWFYPRRNATAYVMYWWICTVQKSKYIYIYTDIYIWKSNLRRTLNSPLKFGENWFRPGGHLPQLSRQISIWGWWYQVFCWPGFLGDQRPKTRCWQYNSKATAEYIHLHLWMYQEAGASPPPTSEILGKYDQTMMTMRRKHLPDFYSYTYTPENPGAMTANTMLFLLMKW